MDDGIHNHDTSKLDISKAMKSDIVYEGTKILEHIARAMESPITTILSVASNEASNNKVQARVDELIKAMSLAEIIPEEVCKSDAGYAMFYKILQKTLSVDNLKKIDAFVKIMALEYNKNFDKQECLLANYAIESISALSEIEMRLLVVINCNSREDNFTGKSLKEKHSEIDTLSDAICEAVISHLISLGLVENRTAFVDRVYKITQLGKDVIALISACEIIKREKR
jgi:hypothetical protein